MAKERAAQIEGKIKMKELLSQEESDFIINWRKQLAEMEQQELKLQQARKQAYEKTSQIVEQQVK
jgi:hypothetical protein